MKRYRCGCRVAAIGEVNVSAKDGAGWDNGEWFRQRNNADGDHYVQPCTKHLQGVVVRWGTSRLMGAARGQA